LSDTIFAAAFAFATRFAWLRFSFAVNVAPFFFAWTAFFARFAACAFLVFAASNATCRFVGGFVGVGVFAMALLF
jgi:hypothetical protein